MRRGWIFAAGVAASGACAAPGTPVPVLGEVAALEGEWLGEYWSVESGRRGSIVFRLTAGSDTARGDVLLTASRPPMQRPPDSPDVWPPERMSRPLAITFVRMDQRVVSGRLEPYRDPDCGCLLTTTFLGRLTGDTLAGTFSSYHQEMAKRVTGEWRVVRR